MNSLSCFDWKSSLLISFTKVDPAPDRNRTILTEITFASFLIMQAGARLAPRMRVCSLTILSLLGCTMREQMQSSHVRLQEARRLMRLCLGVLSRATRVTGLVRARVGWLCLGLDMCSTEQHVSAWQPLPRATQ